MSVISKEFHVAEGPKSVDEPAEPDEYIWVRPVLSSKLVEVNLSSDVCLYLILKFFRSS